MPLEDDDLAPLWVLLTIVGLTAVAYEFWRFLQWDFAAHLFIPH